MDESRFLRLTCTKSSIAVVILLFFLILDILQYPPFRKNRSHDITMGLSQCIFTRIGLANISTTMALSAKSVRYERFSILRSPYSRTLAHFPKHLHQNHPDPRRRTRSDWRVEVVEEVILARFCVGLNSFLLVREATRCWGSWGFNQPSFAEALKRLHRQAELVKMERKSFDEWKA